MYLERIKRMLDEVEDIANQVNSDFATCTDASVEIDEAMLSIYRILDDLIDSIEKTE